MRKGQSQQRANDKSRKPNSDSLLKKKKIESGSETSESSSSIFRSDFLKHNLAKKSGYVFFYDFNKFALANNWLQTLKNSKEYKPIQIEQTASINDALSLLHNETTRLFKGFDWVLKINEETDHSIDIFYYESLGTLDQYNLPIDWIDKSEDVNFRKAGLILLKCISEAFGIDMISNDIIEMITEPCKKKEKFDKKRFTEYWKDWYGIEDVEEEQEEYDKCLIQYKSHIEDVEINLSKEFEQYNNYIEGFSKHLHRVTNSKYKNWLSKGRKLLLRPVQLNDFHLTPHDINESDGSPLNIKQAVFFPYTFENKIFEQYEEWINDFANNIGVNDIFNFGVLTKNNQISLSDPESLFDLLNWIKEGRKLYFELKNESAD